MMNKSKVVEEVLILNPDMRIEDITFDLMEEEAYWICEHGEKHLVYSAKGDTFPSSDECQTKVNLLPPLPESGMVQCRRCGAWTPQEMLENGNCPICVDDLFYK